MHCNIHLNRDIIFRFDGDPSVLDDLFLDYRRPALNIALKGKIWIQ